MRPSAVDDLLYLLDEGNDGERWSVATALPVTGAATREAHEAVPVAPWKAHEAVPAPAPEAHEAVAVPASDATPKPDEAAPTPPSEETTSRGFTQVPKSILRGEHRTRRGPLTLSARVLYALILDFAGMEDRVCKASQMTLAGLLGLHDRQVRALINELCDAGVIERRRRGGGLSNVLIPLVLTDRQSTAAHTRQLTAYEQHGEGSNNKRRTDSGVPGRSCGSEECA